MTPRWNTTVVVEPDTVGPETGYPSGPIVRPIRLVHRWTGPVSACTVVPTVNNSALAKPA